MKTIMVQPLRLAPSQDIIYLIKITSPIRSTYSSCEGNGDDNSSSEEHPQNKKEERFLFIP
jgi:hypothetical protein